jgi:hypothetical protein
MFDSFLRHSPMKNSYRWIPKAGNEKYLVPRLSRRNQVD